MKICTSLGALMLLLEFFLLQKQSKCTTLRIPNDFVNSRFKYTPHQGSRGWGILEIAEVGP